MNTKIGVPNPFAAPADGGGPAPANQWWSSAGSAGTVNIADIGKVVFANSVVQLQGIDLVIGGAFRGEKVSESPLAAFPPVQTQAVIRYGVTPAPAATLATLLPQAVEGGVLNPVQPGPVLGLKLRYRDGSGRVVAVLIQVDIATGTETNIATFDSEAFTRSNQFQVNGPGLGTALDFSNNAYYVELTLTGFSNPPMVMLFPPKVSVIQLVPQQIE